MSKRPFKDHYGLAVDNFDRVLKSSKGNDSKTLTLKEQIEKEKILTEIRKATKIKEKAEQDRFIQTSPNFVR